MSYEAAIGQIDQILRWQQQIQEPAAAATSPATGAAGATSAAAGTTGNGFAAALAEAQAGAMSQAINPSASGSGTTGATDGLAGLLTGQMGSGAGIGSTGALGGSDSQLLSLLQSLESTQASSSAPTYNAAPASGPTDPRIQAMTQEANSLLGKPYVWGGGHSGWGPQAGYDCSGFVSAVLHAGGYLSAPQDTTTLPSAPGIEQGPGQYVTIYDRSQPGQNGHVIIAIDGQFYESGGQQGPWGGGGGVQRIATPSAAYLASFDSVLHPAGL